MPYNDDIGICFSSSSNLTYFLTVISGTLPSRYTTNMHDEQTADIDAFVSCVCPCKWVRGGLKWIGATIARQVTTGVKLLCFLNDPVPSD